MYPHMAKLRQKGPKHTLRAFCLFYEIQWSYNVPLRMQMHSEPLSTVLSRYTGKS